MTLRPLLTTALAATFALLPDARAQQPSPVRVDPARVETIGDRRLVTGDVRARRSSLVASREAGVLVEMPVREGDVVAAGDLLGRLDADRLDLELSILDAQIDAADALIVERERDVEQATRDLATLQELAARQAANPKEVADAATLEAVAHARRDQAVLDVAALEARKALLAKRRADSELRAPFDGLVVRRTAEIGQWLAEGAAVVELLSHEDLEAWLEVPQRFLAAARAHAGTIRLQLDATGRDFTADGARIVPVVDPLARTFTMIVPLSASAAPGLANGMSITAWIPTGETREHVTVSSDAILRNDVGTYVYVARPPTGEGAPHTAAPVPVDVLFTSGGRVVVEGALTDGVPVIVEGNERLFPMAPVIPMPRDDAGPETRR